MKMGDRADGMAKEEVDEGGQTEKQTYIHMQRACHNRDKLKLALMVQF